VQRASAFPLLLICLSGLGEGLAVATCHAELIYFRKGGEVQLPAAIEAKRVILSMPDGRVEFAREDVLTVVPGFWPPREWDARRQKARARGFEERLASTWWAIENGLTVEAAEELKELHAVDPKHLAVARMAAVLDRLEKPADDPDYARFQKALGVETTVARGPHVILLHQHPDAEASERIAILERVILGYHLHFAAQGVELAVPRHRLTSALFADKTDYLAFLRSENANAFATTRGYYHPTWNAVVAFDARSTDEQRTQRSKLAGKRDELRRFGEIVENAPARSRVKVRLAEEAPRTVAKTEAKALIARLDREVTCETMLLDLDWRSIDLGTAAHEMIHQLASDSGLVTQHTTFPVWLHEGLAAQFEVIRGGRWAGISRAHDLRLPDWRRVQNPLSLARLVGDAGFGHGYRRDLYAQAWALVYFLRTQHPQQFLTFLDLLRSPSAGEPSPDSAKGDRVVDAFRRAFGTDFDRLESDWQTFMKTVKTPLEQNAAALEPTQKRSAPTTRAKN
jgi:hypothetical protein